MSNAAALAEEHWEQAEELRSQKEQMSARGVI
jgi:hypothetical protein